jgi:PAS domain S-box-containing protein
MGKKKIQPEPTDLPESGNNNEVEINDTKPLKEVLAVRLKILTSIYDSMSEGIALHDIIYDHQGKPMDYIITDVNPAYERITGLKKGDIIGKNATMIYSVENAPYIDIYSKVASTGDPVSFETFFPPMGKHFSISVFSPSKGKFGTLFLDITNSKKAEQKLMESEEKYRNIVETAGEGIVIAKPTGQFTYMNKKWCEMIGYEPEEMIGKTALDFLYIDTAGNNVMQNRRQLNAGESLSGEISYRRKNGNILITSYNATPIFDNTGNHVANLAMHSDITERKQIEEELKKSHEIYTELVRNAQSMIFKMDTDGKFTFVNEFALNFFGYKEEEIIGKTPIETITPHIESSGRNLDLMVEKIYEDPDKFAINLNENIKKNGERVWVEWHNKALFDKKGRRTGHIAIGVDVTKRIRAQEDLKASQDKLNIALENGNIGVWEWDLKTDEVIWDERMEKMFGLKPGSFEKTYKAFENLIHDEDITHVKKAIKDSLEKELPYETLFRVKSTNNKIKYISAKAVVNKDKYGYPVSLTGVCFDVTSLREGTEELVIKLNEELLRSNKELESFAYVASHDLQEPLRMVTSFTQLLEHQYTDKLDHKAREYIRFAVDGSKRMYDLINGLLAYSRIQTKGKTFIRVNLNHVLNSVSKNLSLQIKESNALVKVDELPIVFADESQMIQLFQNLIGNSIKFSNDTPKISITSSSDAFQHVISVKDEGIGIEPQYFEKIFQIFQRLQAKEQYEGIGIGLAVCKRIVERHSGKIWVESELGKGSVFIFTIPKNNHS